MNAYLWSMYTYMLSILKSSFCIAKTFKFNHDGHIWCLLLKYNMLGHLVMK